MSILIRDASILTLDQDDHFYVHADILILEDRIVQIGQDISSMGVDRIMDGRGKLIMPGLNIAHTHSHGNLFKGAFDGLPLELWLLDVFPPQVDRWVSSRFSYLSTCINAAEMLLNGTTSVQDDVAPQRDLQDSIFQAYLDIGLRATQTIAMADQGFYSGLPFLNEMPAPILNQLSADQTTSCEDQIFRAEKIIEKWHGRGGRLNAALAPSWPQGCSDKLLREVECLSHCENIPIHTHVLETNAQFLAAEQHHNESIIQHLSKLGLLSPRLSIVHGIWVTTEDISLLADAGTTVIHNPCFNLALGSGLMPLCDMLQAGINIALGVDEAIHCRQNPFEMMRLAALIHKIANPNYHSWPTAGEILLMATQGGARSELIQDSVGILAPGMKADIILLDINSVHFTPLNNLKNQLVYCETGDSVTSAIINGVLVMENKKILTLDLDEIKRELRELSATYLSQTVTML